MGAAHRIKHVEAVLQHVMAKPGVWSASASDIHAAWVAAEK
jgi:allantoinase